MGDDIRIIQFARFVFQGLVLATIFGYFLAEDSKFLLVQSGDTHLLPSCPPNEELKTCLTNCSNCEQRGICLAPDCEHHGCDCIPNFVRLTSGGACEPVSKCPIPKCAKNEIYRDCGPICEWSGTSRCRIVGCEHKCYCKEGFLRNWDDVCIPKADAPTKSHCAREENRTDSGPVDEWCLHAEGEIVSNATQNETLCYCQEGFKRNILGHCIEEENCQYVRCYGIETYQLCPRKCNTTCRNYGKKDCAEDGFCSPGCFCPEGFVMDDYRQCVRPHICPPGSNPFVPTVVPTTQPPKTSSLSWYSTTSHPTTSKETSEEIQSSTATEASSTPATTTEGPTVGATASIAVTKPPKVAIKPSKEAIKASKEATKALKEVTKPPKDVTKPPQEITKPSKDVTKPPQEITKPPQEVTNTPQEVTKPPQDVTTHPNEATNASIAVASESTTVFVEATTETEHTPTAGYATMTSTETVAETSTPVLKPTMRPKSNKGNAKAEQLSEAKNSKSEKDAIKEEDDE